MRDPRREQPMINERIRFPQVRVIDDQNAQVGIMETRDALDLARERGYDLILVAAQANPPVCRIMDYGKFKYEKSKRDKTAHKKSAATEMKTVRLHPRTSTHDREVLERHSERFLREGHKVRVVCQFKGRENAYPELGRGQLDAVAEALAEIATVEGTIVKQGRDMAMMLAPKPGLKPLSKTSKDDQEAEDVAGVEAFEVSDEDAEFEAQQEALRQAADEQAADEQASDDNEVASGDAESPA